jgi:hypothetical protein
MSFISVSQKTVIIIQQPYTNCKSYGPWKGEQGQQLIKLWLARPRSCEESGVRGSVAHVNIHCITSTYTISVKKLTGINHFRDLVADQRIASKLILYK